MTSQKKNKEGGGDEYLSAPTVWKKMDCHFQLLPSIYILAGILVQGKVLVRASTITGWEPAGIQRGGERKVKQVPGKSLARSRQNGWFVSLQRINRLWGTPPSGVLPAGSRQRLLSLLLLVLIFVCRKWRREWAHMSVSREKVSCAASSFIDPAHCRSVLGPV